MGGTCSPDLMRVACSLWDWCLQRGITLSASHLPDLDNVIADQKSRDTDVSRVDAPQGTLLRGQKVLGTFQHTVVDLFASRLNHQLSKYMSWKPDPGAMSNDAFKTSWKKLEGYAFPLDRKMFRMEQSTTVLIAPAWQNHPWFPVLLIEFPLLLPWCKDVLTDPGDQLHPLVVQKHLRLAAWKISSNSMLQQEFQSKLQNCLSQDGAMGRMQRMGQAGNGGVAGVKGRKLSHFSRNASHF